MEANRTFKSIEKATKWRSVLSLKCPRCREGSLFVSKNPYSLWNGMHMAKQCSVCNQDLRIEPGFYLGALWAGFPIIIVLTAMLSGMLTTLLRIRLTPSFLLITVILLALQPLINRWGRAIWIAIFVGFQEELGH